MNQPIRSNTGTFVVEVEAGPDDHGLRGRVEHLGSGAEIRFGSADDLLSFRRDRTRGTGRKGDRR